MSTRTLSVWPHLGTTVTLASGYVVTAAGAIAVLTDEIWGLLATEKLLTWDPTLLNPNPSPIPPTSGTGSSVSVATSALLSATLGPTSGMVGTTQGCLTANDTGGGDFYFDYGSTTTVDGALVLSGSGGRWKRIVQDNMLNVRWFGAVGDGVADDTAAIQAAINACTSGSGGVYIPRGNYRITASLKCGNAYNSILGIRVVGETQTPANFEPTTKLIWDSASTTTPLFWFSGYNFHFEGLGVYAAAGRTLQVAFTLSNLTAASTFNSSSSWRRCTVRGDVGTVQNGFALGAYNGAFINLENCSFDECYCFALTSTCFSIHSGQPYNISLNRCYAQGQGSTPTGFGLYVAGVQGTGSVAVNNSDFQNLEVVAYVYETNLTLQFSEGEYENCKKIYYGRFFGVSSTLSTVSFKDARMNNTRVGVATANFLAGDTAFFVSKNGSTLKLDGMVVDDAAFPVTVEANYGSMVVSRGCTWSYNYPFVISSDYGDIGAHCGGLWSTGDRSMNNPTIAGSQTYPIAPRVGGINASYSGALSTISGAATSIAVTLPVSEMVSDYNVRLEVDSVTGAPTAGSTAAYVTSKTASGFTITVPTAPGGVAAVTFRYTTWR